VRHEVPSKRAMPRSFVAIQGRVPSSAMLYTLFPPGPGMSMRVQNVPFQPHSPSTFPAQGSPSSEKSTQALPGNGAPSGCQASSEAMRR
jgi:hypothetical protein